MDYNIDICIWLYLIFEFCKSPVDKENRNNVDQSKKFEFFDQLDRVLRRVEWLKNSILE